MEKYVAAHTAYADQDALDILKTILRAGDHAATVTYIMTKVFDLHSGKEAVVKRVEFLINSLRPLIDQHGVEMLTPLCSNLMHYWFTNVLGNKPEADCDSVMQSISQWSCSCQYCPRVRCFLQTSLDASLQLHRIGAPTRKHIEVYLIQHARLAVTYSTIGGSPQGLMVRTCTNLFVRLQ